MIVGTPYSAQARSAALTAIGGDSFAQTFPALLQQLIVAVCVSGSYAVTPHAPYSAQAQIDALASIGGDMFPQTIPELLQQLTVALATHGV